MNEIDVLPAEDLHEMAKNNMVAASKIMDEFISTAMPFAEKLNTVLDINYIPQSKHKAYKLKSLIDRVIDTYYSELKEIEFLEKLEDIDYDEYPYKRIEDNGYVMLYAYNFRGMRSEHRYVMDKHLGRRLNSKKLVHHVDEDKTNNKIENLMVMSAKEHNAHHRKNKKENR